MRFLCLLALVTFTSCTSSIDSKSPRDAVESQCQFTRAAFDIGSGEIKMQVAKVDVCKREILTKLMYEDDRKIDFKESVLASEDLSFSQSIQDQGIEILRSLKALSMAHSPDQFVAVGTSAFRQAKNGRVFAERIQRELGIDTHIITSDEEGILGYLGVVAKKDIPAEKLVVWDIGGGSKQFTTLKDDQKSYRVFSDGYAAIEFRNAVIEKIQGHDPKVKNTPNPVGAKNVARASELVEINAGMIPQDIRSKINSSDTKIIGIGGVHYYSIREQTGVPQSVYKRADIEKAIAQRVEWNDEKLARKYSTTDVTNLILVLTYMRNLGIDQVETLKVNMTDGLLLWEPDSLYTSH